MLRAADIKLPNNYLSYLVHLRSPEKRLAKEEDLRENYTSTNEQFCIRSMKLRFWGSHGREPVWKSFYQPHDPVVNLSEPGMVRKVLNGAAKFHGASLSKSLPPGPDLLQNLIYVLLCFPQQPYAVSADIEGKILQVGVKPSDQTSLLYLWRKGTATKFEVYQFTRLIFVAKDSPTCANYALQRIPRDNAKFYPRAAKAILEKF